MSVVLLALIGWAVAMPIVVVALLYLRPLARGTDGRPPRGSADAAARAAEFAGVGALLELEGDRRELLTTPHGAMGADYLIGGRRVRSTDRVG